jgi:hypothetical protein
MTRWSGQAPTLPHSQTRQPNGSEVVFQTRVKDSFEELEGQQPLEKRPEQALAPLTLASWLGSEEGVVHVVGKVKDFERQAQVEDGWEVPHKPVFLDPLVETLR